MKIVKDKKEAIRELFRISSRTNFENNNEINTNVEKILRDVKLNGDVAVEKYTKKFDGFLPSQCKFSFTKAWDETKTL